MKKIIVANWKMNLPNLREWRSFRAPKSATVVICPPFPYLGDIKRWIRNVKLGAQDVFWENPTTDGGPYTGEISPAMLKGFDAEYAIVGHSERRRWLGETDEMINKKVSAAVAAGLKVILCVGEPLSVRRKGLAAAKRYVADQLRKDLRGLKKILHSKFYILNSRLIVAYEPVWAIGTGRSDKPAETVEMTRFIKRFCTSQFALCNLSVLYGGSVNSKNAQNFLQYKEINGALVGGASLKVEEFKKIVNIR